MNYKCDAIIVACIDYRFQRALDTWASTHIGYGNYDRVGIAGGVKNWTTVLEQIDISYNLHDIEVAILINHEDCGAYGDEGTRERHVRDLKGAQEDLISKYPGLTVETYYAKFPQMNADGELVPEFEKVN